MKIKVVLIFILSALIILNETHLFYLNIFTHSLPYGIYKRVSGVALRDDYAATCLTPSIARYGIDRGYLAPGNCPTGTVLVLKKIKGLPKDHFYLDKGLLELNGRFYPLKKNDSSQRPLKIFYHQGVLGPGQYMLLSDFVPNSWDSRYWGPVGVQFLLKPWWVFEHERSSL